ncbi:MAG: YqaJ viral recombinase family protein [Mycoplasmataceae bacterium]|nr:YqaJ viral recombinase family protein [Mycoplasmataceae bacterium]
MNKINLFRNQKYANVEQKSQEWLNLRKNFITASNVYKIFDKNDEYIEYIKEKASGISKFKGNDATCFGEIFEPVAREIYMYLVNEYVEEFGLIVNEKLPYCAVSPDGVTESDRLLEIKCPYTRVITGGIPNHYYHQIQLQLHVCDCDECDFLECKFTEIDIDEFNNTLHYMNDHDKFICVCKTYNYQVECFINGPAKTINNVSNFSRYSDNNFIKHIKISDVPKNNYWNNPKPRYYKLDFISLQTVDRNNEWLDLHRNDLNETIPFVEECRKDITKLNNIQKHCECEF